MSDDRKEQFPIKRKLTLLDLNYDVMDMVLSKVDFRHQRYLRGVCKKLRQLQTSYIMNKYDGYVKAFAYKRNETETEIEKELRIMLQVMDETSKYFLQEGFESLYASNILHFYELQCPSNPSVIYEFLNRLQICLELPSPNRNLSDRLYIRDRRITYTLALFRLFREFHNFRILESVMHLMHWQLIVELPDIFLGVLNQSNVSYRTNNRDKRMGFLSILAELLFYVRRGSSFGGFKDTGNVVYTYGFKAGGATTRKPRLEVKCMVLAPKSLLRLLEDVITGKVTTIPDQVPMGGVFKAGLKVNSKPLKRFYDYGTMHINIFHDDEHANRNGE